MRQNPLFSKTNFLFCILLCLNHAAWAQQFSYGNGSSGSLTVTGTQTVNQYYKVTAIHGNQISYVGTYNASVGDVIMLMQMNTGVWEFDTIIASGNPLTVSSGRRTIDTSGAWVQIITVPQYSELKLDSGAILTCGAWNDTVGGVLCFMVQDSFIINQYGKCDVSAKGFIDHNSLSSPNLGGAGGIGGLAGATGDIGGSNGIILMSGSNGGGDGGLHGGGGGGSTRNFRRPSCDYCAFDNTNGYNGTAWNGTNLSGGFNSHILMGGSGIPGYNGPSGAGGGGGGGGANGSGVAQDGSPGGSGGNGGSIGTAGIGGGILFFTANTLIVPSGAVFMANGGNGGDGGNGSNGGAGGNGGNGGDCLTGGGGGGGGGGNGGSGGGGGWGGASGVVYSVANHTSSSFNYSNIQILGGSGGRGGSGGLGGSGGVNGQPGSSCGGGSGGGNAFSSDSCSLETLMNALNDLCDTIYHQYPSGGWWCTSTYPGANGYWVYGNEYQYHNITQWEYTTAWARQVDSVTVDLWTTLGGRTYYTRITDQYRHHNPAPLLNNLMNGNNHIYYSSAASGIVCDTSSVPRDTFLATCPVILATAPMGSNGGNGSSGAAGSSGGGGGGGGGGGSIIRSCTNEPIIWPTVSTNMACGCSFSLSNWETQIRGGGGIYSIRDTMLAAGLYMVYASGVYGCMDSHLVNVDTIEGYGYGVSLRGTGNVTCIQDSNGSASFWTYTINNGYSCSSYQWTIAITGPNGYKDSLNSLSYGSSSHAFTGLKRGTYFYTITSGVCSQTIRRDSFVIGVYVPVTRQYNVQFCLGDSLLYHNHYITQPGIYVDTIYNTSGCIDELHVNNVTTYSYYRHVDVALCPGQTAYWQNRQFTQSGYYQDTNNCTLTDIYVYNVITPQSVLYDTICQGSSFNTSWGSFSQTGVYYGRLYYASIYYCDSFVTLNLYVKPAQLYDRYDTICSGGSLVSSSQAISISGIYYDTLRSISGCDSISVLHLFVSPPQRYDRYDTICHGSSLVFSSRAISISGLYYDTLTSISGCDSISVLHLFVSPPLLCHEYDSICHGGSLVFGNQYLNDFGIYYDTLTSSAGCDSIIALHLFILSQPQSHNYDTICQGRSYVFDSDTLLHSATITHTYTLPAGCDSTATLHLWVSAPISLSKIDTICVGQSYLFGNNSYDTSGIYTYTAASVSSCDTLHTLYLTVLTNDTPSAIITVSRGPVIGSIQTDTFSAIYVHCQNPAFSWYHDTTALNLHTSVITYSYLATQHDSILCRIDCDNRCTSVAYVFSNSLYTDIQDLPSFINEVTVYPNPNHGVFSLDIKANTEAQTQISILDLMGQTIETETLAIHSGSNKKNITLDENIASGIYILRLSAGGRSVYFRLVLDR